MATFRRILVPGATWFFTLVTYNRRPLLTRPEYYSALKNALREVMKTRPFTIDAFVLLPEHLHCIWTLPDGDADISSRWNIVKRLTSQSVREILPPGNSIMKKRGELSLWQRRFYDHLIRDEVDYERHFDYIHRNPVKHGYVKSVADWPYSSFHRSVQQGIYTSDWCGDNEMSGEFGE